MKKSAAIILSLTLLLVLLGGCGDKKTTTEASASSTASASTAAQSANSGSSSAKESASSSDDSASSDKLKKAKNASEGYTNYITVKGKATNRITKATDGNDSLGMSTAMGMLNIAMVDLELIPLTAVVDDVKTAEMALSLLGVKDLKLTGSTNDYTITYTDSNEKAIKQTCKYDVAKDQLTSTVYAADGSVSMFFEYVNLGDFTYAAQYYYPNEGKYELIRSYFDKDKTAGFGVTEVDKQPDSILGKSGLTVDFAKSDIFSMIMKDGKLTVTDKGTTTTN